MSKYNWRTHEWKVGDRCVVRSIEESPFKATVIQSYHISHPTERLLLKNEVGNIHVRHRAECIPLRKKEKLKLREYWIGHRALTDTTCVSVSKPVEPFAYGWDIIHVREVRKPKESK